MRGGGGNSCCEAAAATAAVGSCTPSKEIAGDDVGVGVEAGVDRGGVKGVGDVDPGGPEPGAGGWFEADGWSVVGDVAEQGEDEVAAGGVAGEDDLVGLDLEGVDEVGV